MTSLNLTFPSSLGNNCLRFISDTVLVSSHHKTKPATCCHGENVPFISSPLPTPQISLKGCFFSFNVMLTAPPVYFQCCRNDKRRKKRLGCCHGNMRPAWYSLQYVLKEAPLFRCQSCLGDWDLRERQRRVEKQHQRKPFTPVERGTPSPRFEINLKH